MDFYNHKKYAVSGQPAIDVRNLSKHYRIPLEKKRTVLENVIGLASGQFYQYEEFWALKNVDFKIEHGETFGVIGPNGSGKSTLLKLLAGVLYPNTGTVSINGKIAPFLELGIGFSPELSARQNIYLYGAIMGLKRREVEKKYDEILEFAELKRFENVKLKNYSSGMVVRLAFSTAIQTNPDILLVDEVLSVGDESFQHKCAAKIDEIRKNGKTIILVSHSLGTVRNMCKRTMLLKSGKVIMIGDTGKVVDEYLRIVNS